MNKEAGLGANEPGRRADASHGHSRNPGDFVQIQFGEEFPKLCEALRTVLEVAKVREVIFHDHLRQAIEERHVGAGQELKVKVRIFSQLNPPGIDHDQRSALQGLMFETRSHYGMRLCGIGTRDDDRRRMVNVGIGRGCRAGAGDKLQGQCRGGMANAGTAIHVVRAQVTAKELL